MIKVEDRIKVAKTARKLREAKEAADAALTPMERILRDQLDRPSLKPRKINARVFPK